jgi:hypothetical protein
VSTISKFKLVASSTDEFFFHQFRGKSDEEFLRPDWGNDEIDFEVIQPDLNDARILTTKNLAEIEDSNSSWSSGDNQENSENPEPKASTSCVLILNFYCYFFYFDSEISFNLISLKTLERNEDLE